MLQSSHWCFKRGNCPYYRKFADARGGVCHCPPLWSTSVWMLSVHCRLMPSIADYDPLRCKRFLQGCVDPSRSHVQSLRHTKAALMRLGDASKVFCPQSHLLICGGNQPPTSSPNPSLHCLGPIRDDNSLSPGQTPMSWTRLRAQHVGTQPPKLFRDSDQ